MHMIHILVLMSLCTVSLCTACATTPGTSLPASTRVLGQATIYQSDNGDTLEIINDTGAGVTIIKLPNGEMTVLPPEITGLAGRYRNDRMTVWELEGSALLWIDGTLVFKGTEKQ